MRRLCNVALWALGILAVLAIMPESVPVLGSMTVKYICLIGFVVLTLAHHPGVLASIQALDLGQHGLGRAVDVGEPGLCADFADDRHGGYSLQ